MRIRTLGVLALLIAVGVLATSVSAADKDPTKPKSGKASAVDQSTQAKPPLTAAEKAKRAAEEAEARVADEALRKKVAGNIAAIVDGLNASNVQKAKLTALTSELQWKSAVDAFETTRGEEIHEHAHKIVPKVEKLKESPYRANGLPSTSKIARR